MTFDEVLDAGLRKVRLPFWNDSAYLWIPDDGPWAYVHDAGRETAVLMVRITEVGWEAVA